MPAFFVVKMIHFIFFGILDMKKIQKRRGKNDTGNHKRSKRNAGAYQ